MNEKEARELFAEIKENRMALETCKKHDFSIDITPEKPIGKRYRCTRCGGTVDSSAKYWYEKGMMHA